MRLTDVEIAAIKNSVYKVDPQAIVFLFGSRTRTNARGGDINLLIESSTIDFEEKLAILVDIKQAIGDQKIDIILSKNVANDSDAFINTIRKDLVKL